MDLALVADRDLRHFTTVSLTGVEVFSKLSFIKNALLLVLPGDGIEFIQVTATSNCI